MLPIPEHMKASQQKPKAYTIARIQQAHEAAIARREAKLARERVRAQIAKFTESKIA